MAEIAKCRWCGTDAGIVRRVSSENYFVACMCQHEIIGPKMPTESEAITAWNEMMGQLDTTENDRRDRIERAAIAIYASMPPNGAIYESIDLASKLIDAIDASFSTGS